MADELGEEHHNARLDESVRNAYGAAAAPDAAAEARVLARLAEAPPARRGWWFEPHLFELRPAPILTLAAAVLAVALWAGSRFGGTLQGGEGSGPAASGERVGAPREVASPGTATGGAMSRVPVTFVLRTPDAARVNLVGDFNSWDAEATPLAHDGSRDLWVVELELARGMHSYAFVVDGREWRTDPSAPLAADATYGARTSVLVVEGAGL
jgi:hypothetical protein